MIHFRYRDRVGSGSGISTDCHLYYVEQRRAWFGIYHPPVTRSHFSQSPRHNFFALLKPHRAACRPAQPSLHLESPNPLPHLPTPARPSKTIHSSPTPPDASQLTPKTDTDRRRRQHFSDRLWARQQAAAHVTEGEYAVNTSTENTSPPSASRPLPQTRVCRHQHRAIGADKQLMFKQQQSPLEAGRQICKQQRSPGIKITRGEPSTTSASVLVTGHAERAVWRKYGPAKQPAITTGRKDSRRRRKQDMVGAGRAKKTRPSDKYIGWGRYVEHQQVTRRQQTKYNNRGRSSSRGQQRPGQGNEIKNKSQTAPQKILTWDENKTQTDGSPKTNGRDIRSARRWNGQIGPAGH